MRGRGSGLAVGGMVNTVGDIHRFYPALFNGKIISQPLLAALQKQQLANCNSIDCTYGLG
ncbi:hypothetical protein GCM10027299_11510 [Larkinella ripae]